VAVVAVAAGVVDAQSGRPSSTVTVRGRVLTADTGTAIPYARLRVAGADWLVRTDIDGTFAIDVPARGTLVISKAWFVPAESELPRTSSESEIRLTRAAAIAGRVVDDFGEPIVDARVLATLTGRDPSAAPGATTDDHGEYRIGGLAPGRYLVAARTTGAEQVTTADLQSVVNGAPYERGRKRLIEAPVPSRATNDRGEFRLFAIPPGEYVVRATASADTAPELVVGYPPVFYPGTQSGADARALALDVGTELTGLDFALAGAPTARVTGRTFDAGGKPTSQLRLSLVSSAGVATTLEQKTIHG